MEPKPGRKLLLQLPMALAKYDCFDLIKGRDQQWENQAMGGRNKEGGYWLSKLFLTNAILAETVWLST